MALAYTLGRATAGLLRAVTGRSASRPAATPASAPSRPAWRDARTESPTLRQAVEAMEGHADLLAQIGDGWLLSANLKQVDVSRFYANVARSGEIARALEEDCAAVVSELRALEHQRDHAAQFDADALRANQWADRLVQANEVLRTRLASVVHARGLDINAVLMDAARRCTTTERAEVDTRLTAYAHETPASLKEWL